MSAKKRLLSGMQPSGALHLGNYMGALKQWIALTEEYDCLFCVVDYHAITIPYDTSLMQPRIIEATADYLAGGLDPEKCTIFVQSDVPEHMELAWIFNSITPLGQLMRMTQFKQKAQQFAAKELGDASAQETEEDTASEILFTSSDQSGKNDALQIPLEGIGRINAGLFTYPVLQAADILLYKASIVPVGEDQVQHIELTRDVGRRFNNRFGDVFPICDPYLAEGARVMGLDAVNKMSKSLGNHIALAMDSKEVTERVTRKSVSDTRRVRKTDPGVPEECNIYAWHKLFSTKEDQEWAKAGCENAEIGCFKCKKTAAKRINELLNPIRERRQEIMEKPDYIHEILNEGARKARVIAKETMGEVREALGLRKLVD